MKITTLKQGSPDWHQFRSCHFGASEAPSMLGESKFKSRNQLLHEKATGIVPEVDAATQRRFDDGYRAEELARGLAEAMINDDLYPATGEEGKLSASFDGLTLDQSTAWEHKLINDTLRACDTAADLPVCYRIQMEQCLMLSGAERCLFSATKWEETDDKTDFFVNLLDGGRQYFNLLEEKHIWYTPDYDLRDRLLQGWTQFALDLESYQHVEHIEKPKAEAILNLPALSVQATGMVTYSNLPEFKAAAEHYIASINTELATDQQFADAEAVVKFCKSTEDTLEVTKKAILAQTATIDEVIRTVDHIQAQLRDKRLMLDKLVKTEKESRKLTIVMTAANDYTAHTESLEAEIKPIRLAVVRPDFGGATKGLKKLSAMQEAVDTALRDGKFVVDQAAKDVRAKLAWCKEHAAGMSFLFPDLQQIIVKPLDDFTLTISSRIKAHQEAEAERVRAHQEAAVNAERARIQKEEVQRVAIQAAATAKAEREAAEKLAEAEAKLRAAQAEEDALVDSIWKQARMVEGDSVQYVNKAIVQFETVAKAWESDPRPRVASAIADARQQLAEKLRAADERAKAEQAEAAAIEERRKQAQLDAQAQPFKLSGAKTVVAQAITSRRPNRAELLDAIATTFGTTNEAALDWILQEFRGDIQHEERKAA